MGEIRISAADFTPVSATAEEVRALAGRIEALESRVAELEAESDRRRDYEIDAQERQYEAG